MIVLRVFNRYLQKIQDIEVKNSNIEYNVGDKIAYKLNINPEEEIEEQGDLEEDDKNTSVKESHSMILYDAVIMKKFDVESYPSEYLVDASIIRKITTRDQQKIEYLIEKSNDAFELFKMKISKYNLDMVAVSANFSLDDKKLHFQFTAETRVDFRDLLKDLIKTYRKKIFLEQIGPKDRASLISGYGKCGRSRCCSCFLRDLPSVTMEDVRAQNLVYIKSDKLLGNCGKLLCCLKYELDLYNELNKNMPKMKSIIEYNNSNWEILAIDILNQKVKIRNIKDEKHIEHVKVSQIKIIKEPKIEE